jgi:spore cortex formation protein SpoVR/YcgB (stage V sporulation)
MLLQPQAEQTLKYLRTLWGFPVSLESVDQSGTTLKTY